MATNAQPITTIRLRNRHKRQLAGRLHRLHGTAQQPPASRPSDGIRVVCIADTHNTRPVLPPGDVVIHAGDLTEHGSFDEVQTALRWLASQPHRHKVVVAGNHDVLLDEAFLARHPARRYGQTRTRADLDWGCVIYLEDTCVTLTFPPRQTSESGRPLAGADAEPRRLTVFGSPWTPQYGLSAFQYRPEDGPQLWAARLASLQPAPDIVVTHGPPKHHLDATGFRRAGCPYLAAELARLRPRLVVFGHIHASYGREDCVLDGVQRAYENVLTGTAGWPTLGYMGMLVGWARLRLLMKSVLAVGNPRVTAFVNAAAVGGPSNELTHEPIVVEL